MSYPDKRLIQSRFRESLERYIEHGYQPGGFLTAVLANDLKEAVGRADEEALQNIPHIVAYLYNDAPGMAWGSPELVKGWMAHKREAVNAS